MNVSSLTVSTILFQKEKLKEVAESSVVGNIYEDITQSRDVIMQKLERLLTRWINSHIELNMNLSFLIIKEKAVLLFEDLKVKAQKGSIANVEDLEFKASHGWLERFKTRANFHSLCTSGKRASTDVTVVTKFP
jgi:hypothetical protein